MFSFGMQSTGLPSTFDIIFIGGSETLNSDLVTSSMESRQQNNLSGYSTISRLLPVFPALIDKLFTRGREYLESELPDRYKNKCTWNS